MSTDGAQVRVATTADLPLIEGIEDAGDRLFPTVFPQWELGPSPTGVERSEEPGWLLVTGHPPVGFAHAIRMAGEVLLEQVSVLPQQGRQGFGGALVDEVCRVVAADGFPRVWLRTFADVPWNAPFYAHHGFVRVPVADEPAWMAALREGEARFGLERHGARVAMVRELR